MLLAFVRHWWVAGLTLAVAAAFYLYANMLKAMPGVISEQLEQSLGVGDAALGTLTTLFFLVFALMQLVVGGLIDRDGVKRWILLGCGTCAAGVLVFGASTNLWVAQWGLALAGFGAAFAYIGTLRTIADWFPPQRFAILFGITSMLVMGASAVGNLAMAQLASRGGWQGLVIVFGLAGIVLTALIYLFVKVPPDVRHADPSQPQVSFFRAIKTVLSEKATWILGLAGLFYNMPYSVLLFMWETAFLENVYGRSMVAAVHTTTFLLWGQFVGAPVMGILSDWLGRRKLLIILGATLAAGCIALMIHLPNLGPNAMMVLLFMIGFFSSGVILVFVMAKEALPIIWAATAMAAVNMIVAFDTVIFEPVIGALLQVTGEDYRLIYSILPVSLLLAAGLTASIKELRHGGHG